MFQKQTDAAIFKTKTPEDLILISLRDQEVFYWSREKSACLNEN